MENLEDEEIVEKEVSTVEEKADDTHHTTTIIVNQRVSGNGVGTAGFVLALLAVFSGWIPIAGWILWIIGAILSFCGLFRRPRGLAIAGVIISFIDVILLILVFGFFAAVAATK